MSATLQQIPAVPTLLPKERRFYARIAPKTPIRFTIDDGHDVLMLNMSENGLLIFTPLALTANRVSHVSIPLSGLPDPLQVNVRVVWANKDRKVAGIQLLNLSDYDRERVREWIADAPKPSFSSRSNQPRVAKPFNASPTRPETPAPELVETPADIGSPPIAEAQSSTSTHKTMVEEEPTSEGPIKLKWPLLGAAICLAGVFLYWTGVLGNPFARSAKYLRTTISANSAVPSANKTINAPPSLVPEPPKSTRNPLPNAGIGNSARSRDGLRGPQYDQVADRTIGIPDTRKKTASFGSLPVGTTNPQTSLAFPLRPIHSEMHDDSRQFANLDAGASTTAPSAPNISAIPAPPPMPDTPVIERNVSQRQVVEVHLPSGYRSPFVDLPGGRVLDTPTVTIHMQRSLRLPATFAEASLKDGKVTVGELISPIDSLLSAAQLGPTDFVHVHANIGEDGRVGTVTFIHGPSDISSAVVKAIREWRYRPTLVNGQPVETQCDIEARFRSPARRTARH
jgi:PilZ domain/Gram-negative bacterial TonB protein C-terminal